MNKSCKYCYCSDVCSQDKICKFYYPIDPKSEDEAIEAMIEDNRIEFLSEWFKYIEENQD